MFDTLLVAVDVADTHEATRASEAAVRMARSEGASLHVLNVVPDSGMAIVGASLGPEHSRKMVAQAKTSLEAWAAKSIPEDVKAELHVSVGTIYDQIIRVAGQLKVDAIFVGANRPELRDYLMGPNAARVARHATQSVFVVR